MPRFVPRYMNFPGIALPGGSRVGGPMVNPRAPGARTMLALGGMSPWARHRGDPGLFGDIVKGIGKVVGGAAKVAGRALVGAARATPLGQVVSGALSAVPRIGAPSSRALGTTGGMNLMMPQPPAPGGFNFTDPGMVEVGTVAAGSPGTSLASCGMPGYHLNRKGYWKNTNPALPGASWQEPGTVCVKNRRMNPFNPRAASRAMSRLAGLSKAMKVLDKRMQKMARGAGARRSGGGGRGCGCKKR